MKNYLVSNGVLNFVVIKPENAHETILFAIEELNKYIFLVTQQKLEIIEEKNIKGQNFISIGKTSKLTELNLNFNYDCLNEDGFFIKTVGGNIYIDSYNKLGIIYAVYDFIEKVLGVKFIASDCEYFNKNTEVYLEDLDIVSIPDFTRRIYLNATSMGISNRYIDYEFCLKKRYNHSFINYPEKFGGRSNVWGRGKDQHHNFHYFVPKDLYFVSHPEFYYHDGRYDLGGENGWTIDLLNGITEDGQLDESMDMSVAKIVIEEMKKDIVNNPDIDYFNFEQEDGPFCYPYKENTEKGKILKKYGRSGILIRFCNVVIKELKKWAEKELNNRKIYLVTFAYEYTNKAPVIFNGERIQPIDETVVADENIIIRLALGGNRYYSYFDDNQYEWVKESLKEWKTVANNFMFWAYDCDFSKYLWYLPFRHRISKDMLGFKNMHVSDLIIQGAYTFYNHWLDKIKEYIYSKLLWDSTRDIEQCFSEYLEIYYSVAAPQVKEMMDILDERLKERFNSDRNLAVRICEDVGYKMPENYTSDIIDSCYYLIDKGIKSIEEKYDDGEKDLYVQRLNMVKLSPLFMKLEMYKFLYDNPSLEEHLKIKDEFISLCKTLNVSNIAEGYSIDEYDKIFGETIINLYK